MDWYLIFPTGLVLLWIGVQDFRERQISLIGLIVLFMLALIHSCLALQWRELILRVVCNALFAGIVLVSGTLLVRARRPGDPVSSFIGAGDLLFLLAISPLFTFGSYLVFLNTSMLLILIIYGAFLLLNKSAQKPTIPMAGAMAICLVLVLLLDTFISLELLEQQNWLMWRQS